MAKSSSAERYRLRDGFAAVRHQLLDERFGDRLDRTLGYWALPADRRLPVALMALTLRQILDTPFDVLAGTPGIGQKKLATLILLLKRAIEDTPPVDLSESLIDEDPVRSSLIDFSESDAPLDPMLVSETTWEQWCQTVRDHRLQQERLGRIAPSLQELPTVIWNTPLGEYTSLSLSQVRELKTHGVKRVRVVLDVFRSIHQVLGRSRPHVGLSIRLAPKFVPPLEDWIAEIWQRTGSLDQAELRQNLVLPLINQLAIDAGPLIQKLVEGRLGIEGPPESVRRLAQSARLTRARVYQLLETCQKVMDVRWPEGRSRMVLVQLRLEASGTDPDTWTMFQTLRDLVFPTRPNGSITEEIDELPEVFDELPPTADVAS